jgi:hypothetical protein
VTTPDEPDRAKDEEDNPWRQYQMDSLGLELPRAASGMIVRGDRLYALSLAYRRKCRLTVSVHRFPDGGPARRTETLSLPRATEDCLSPAFAHDQLYIGTTSGLVTLSEGRLRLLSEADGLPGTTIRSMAAYDGKLYLGLGGEKSGFGLYDPSARTSRIIFSSAAVERQRRRKTQVARIVADETRSCLWLLSGVLRRYDAVAGKLGPSVARRSVSVHWGSPDDVVFCRNGFLSVRAGEIWFVDVDTYQEKRLVNLETSLARAPYGSIDNTAGRTFHMPSPVWYDGTRLITSTYNENGPALSLRRWRKAPALARSPSFRLFRPTRHGLLAMDNEGEGYLLRKKNGRLLRAPQRAEPKGRSGEKQASPPVSNPGALVREANRIIGSRGDAAKAMKLWKRVFTGQPAHPSAEKALFYYGLIALDEGKHQEARYAFELYLKRHPNSRWTERVAGKLLPKCK